ncbi:copper chaperone PCu(A)C [Aquabacterium sp.]|uniref:copper chaperone PCu(A)C n=1 Tax=Aquabacterium sp. TaxID=1872578 RepID=UPI002487A18A|nr:copper chaperone PCu(A)C [Aquabacterium sp.]MDI1350530.1 copper chaperone PCu(A)C [Aquabacterium sp.]
MTHTSSRSMTAPMRAWMGAWMGTLGLLPAMVQAHITLPPGGARVGSTYTAAFRVGHACTGAKATTGITLRAPAGFQITDVPERADWTVQRQGQQVRWTPNTPAQALPAGERTTFVVTGRLPEQPGTLWFKVLQQCDQGAADWATVPGVDGAPAKPDFPAARLDVLAAGVAAVDAKLPWVRPAVAGQGATGMFVTLSAPAGARLVGGSTPVAEAVELHTMHMDHNVMRMRALPDGLDLPAGQAVSLAPGSHHLMLMRPRQAIAAGSTVPMTLTFRDPDGQTSRMTLQVPVQITAPEAPAPLHGKPAVAMPGMSHGMGHAGH